MRELILGIDDAGRGPVIGPMILAGCIIDKTDERELKNIGVKDSKDITQKRREILEKKIKEVSISFHVEKISTKEIDSSKEEGLKLNELEANYMAKIINKLNNFEEKIKVVIDCPSAGMEKWTNYLRSKVKNLSNIDLVVEYKADQNHTAVGAASILAKCERERAVENLKKKFGNEIGSGYPSDPATKKFLEKNALKLKNSDLFRLSWATWKTAAEKLNQQKLF